MKKKKADIIRVAQLAKVSPSTVSRVFNHPELVKPATRKKIEDAIKNSGYIRNRAAQTIHGIRSGTIGLIVPTIHHTIFAELVQSFSDAVDENGFTILLASHGYDLSREYSLARKMLEHRVDGVALIGLDHADETFRLIESQETPGILLWNHAETARLPCIGADNCEVGRLIADHVADLGHKEVACVIPPLKGNDRAAQRFNGLSSAFKARGVAMPPQWVLETPYSVAAAKSAVEDLLRGGARPSALIGGNDVLAWGALHAATRFGVKVPDELTVTGIGDFAGSREFEPALTTVRIPARKIGQQGGEAIARAIVSRGDRIVSERLASELIIRKTSANPHEIQPSATPHWLTPH